MNTTEARAEIAKAASEGREANLRWADLRGADLREANLYEANLYGANEPPPEWVVQRRICPESGAFTAYKKLANNLYAELSIPADAKRLGGLLGRKCRASSAVVIAILDHDRDIVDTTGQSAHDPSFIYAAGATVVPSEPFNEDERVECASGIHFFLSFAEAVAY